MYCVEIKYSGVSLIGRFKTSKDRNHFIKLEQGRCKRAKQTPRIQKWMEESP